MISIEPLMPYCDGCPRIDPAAHVSYKEKTVIYCKHGKECERLMEWLDNYRNNQPKIITTYGGISYEES